jgi:polyhydroxybutyrate depolymerase
MLGDPMRRGVAIRTRRLVPLALAIAANALPAQASSGRPNEYRITVDRRERTYLVDLPPRYDSRQRYPLVLDFHGGGGSPAAAREQTGFSTLGQQVGAIVVYPAGSGRLGDDRLLTWNTETCCGYAQRARIDETRFVRTLLDTLQRTYSIDSRRVFATGLSNGGMMAHLVGCRLGDRIAAIAVISGELTVDCRPARPVSVLIIHGTADQNLPFDGGSGRKALSPHDVRPVAYAVDRWRAIDQCRDSASVVVTGAVTHSSWTSCADGTVVELYRIEGGGHAWPGGQRMSRLLDAPSTTLDATRVAWDFFSAHPRR